MKPATQSESPRPTMEPRAGKTRVFRWISIVSGFVVLLYALLLIPSPEPEIAPTPSTGMTNFVWNRDSIWSSLESQLLSAKQLAPAELDRQISALFTNIEAGIASIEEKSLTPDAPVFDELLTNIFHLAPLVAADSHSPDRYAALLFRMRAAVKEQSWRSHWDMSSFATRALLYRLLFGARTAVDELIVQHGLTNSMLELGRASPSGLGRSARLNLSDGSQLTLYSGDLLLSRGDAPTSALIARGNDFRGNFSHVAMAHVDQLSGELTIVEALIQHGLVTTSPAEYASNKLRLAVLRLRSDCPSLSKDPNLPHHAAATQLDRARHEHVPYDFAMNWRDPRKLFCSEVASSAYAAHGIKLWMGMSHLSSMGLKRWLAGFGVRHFQTQEPSDLEYDPQLMLVAEWRGNLAKDREDNAVVDAMLESAEKGARLDFSLWMLPLARSVKAASAIANLFHYTGKIPEGMDASAALRQDTFKKRYMSLASRLHARAVRFRADRGYAPPYWELLRLAKEGDGPW